MTEFSTLHCEACQIGAPPATEEELQKAKQQLDVLLKELGFGVLTILPFSPITIPLVARLARKYEIDIVPEWFKDSLKK